MSGESSLSLAMPPDVLSTSTSIRSVDDRANLVLKNKTDQWVGLLGEGGYLWGNIDPAKAAGPMTIWCFLTGYMSVVHFFSLGRKKLANANPTGIPF